MRQSLCGPRTATRWLAGTIAFALVLLAAPTQAAPARSQNLSSDDSSAVTLRDGVIVDPARGVAYMMGAEGRLEAVRTSDGAVVWSSPDAVKPLLVLHDVVVAQAEADGPGSLPIVTLDREAGRMVAKTSVALPEGVQAHIADRARSWFRTSAKAGADGVAIHWQATRLGKKANQGYVPSPDEDRAPGQPAGVGTRAALQSQVGQQAGSAIVDPRSGAVSRVTTKRAVSAEAQPMTLRAFDGLRGVEGRQFLSADGRHVLVSRAVDTGRMTDRYQWSVYTRGGELLGEVSSARSASPFVVAGPLVLFESMPSFLRSGEETIDRPLQLVAVDLSTGTKAWEQEVRATEFAGPFPP